MIFLLGCGRSGSTLLERVMHDAFEVTAVGEVTYIWEKGLLKNEDCSCGLPFLRCPFWTEVIRDAFGHITEKEARRFDLAFRTVRGRLTEIAGLTGRFARPNVVFREVSSAIYHSAAKLGGGRPILDSSKVPAFAAAMKGLDLARFGALHIFRDACGNVQSLRTPKRRPQSRSMDYAELPPSRSILHAVGRWSILNWEARQLSKKLGDACPTVSYDRFCIEPERHLSALQESFGLSPRRSNANEAWHSVSGNPMRFDPGGTKIRLDDRWKSAMKRSDQLFVRALTRIQQSGLEAAANAWLREQSREPLSVTAAVF